MSDIRVLITDDQPLVRMGLRALVTSEPGLAVVGEAADGAEAVASVRGLAPDVVLMDIRMPGTDGLTALRTIAADPSAEALSTTTTRAPSSGVAASEARSAERQASSSARVLKLTIATVSFGAPLNTRPGPSAGP